MNRREFLAHIGAGALAVVGVSGLVKTLSEFGGQRHQISGYGSSSYGGGAKKH
ncbi:MAG TPA: twin-arginine translocation signal domain-containing protein [Candidatus Saccharimonadales bacterium]|nr:twin-arginine translocation signal domain-containing protein [Candidatus Saccharimonadales bacterium]